MTVDKDLRSLEFDIPTQPESLVQLSLLLAEEEVNLAEAAKLVESDMALAAAVLRAVNSSIYGLKGRVHSVQQAITYLGLREVAALTFEMGLRAAFPPSADLEPIWARASRRGFVMGRLGQQLGVDAWASHSAGLFEECGKAVLFRHASEHYRPMLRAAPNDLALCELERAGFGVSHDALGAALCESWGLALPAAASVRHHVSAQHHLVLPATVQRPTILALSVFAWALLESPHTLDETVQAVAPQAQLDLTLALRGVRRVQALLEAAAEREARAA
jgi:HD-like signal output (HDOD) protein